jgi:hypothetical protein
MSPAMMDFLIFVLRRGLIVLSLSAAEGIIHSALPTTRRWRLQLLCVLYWKSLKRRAGLPLSRFSAAASASSAAICGFTRLDVRSFSRHNLQTIDRHAGRRFHYHIKIRSQSRSCHRRAGAGLEHAVAATKSVALSMVISGQLIATLNADHALRERSTSFRKGLATRLPAIGQHGAPASHPGLGLGGYHAIGSVSVMGAKP